MTHDHTRPERSGEPAPKHHERVLVCFNEHPVAEAVIRRAAQIAMSRHAELYALHVEMPGARTRRSGDEADRLAYYQRLARDLGAQLYVIHHHRLVETIVDFARQHAVTTIVLGKSQRSGFQRLLFGDPVARVQEHLADVPAVVVDSAPAPVP